MKIKTAIQEAISQLKEFRDDEMAAGWEGEAYAYDTAISILKDLLEKEKKQIMEAYWDGSIDEPIFVKACERYYNETFNPDEK
jgi:hypothetical protein